MGSFLEGPARLIQVRGVPKTPVHAPMARVVRVTATVVAVTIGALAAGASVSVPAVAAAWGDCPNATVSSKRLPASELRTAVVCLVNAERAEFGLPRLREAGRLDSAAQSWVEAMMATGEFGHGSGPGAHVTAAGLRWSAVGENVASGFATPLGVVAAWMTSVEHCQIILSPLYTLVGTGVSPHPVSGYASGPATWAQDFALPAGSRAPSHNWGPAERCR